MEQFVYTEMSTLENTHWWFVARRQYLRAIITNLFAQRSGLRFCEVGCGTGGNLPMLGEFAKVDAVEMNDQARKIVLEKNIANIEQVYSGYLPDNLPLETRYDGIFALDVIEHVENDSAAIAALKDSLAPDGYLVTTVPAYQWLWSDHDVANHHFRRYVKARYIELFEKSGYEIQYASYFNTILFPLAVASRLLSKVRKQPQGDQAADLKLPGESLNRLLCSLFSFEKRWALKATIPFGLSLVVVAKHSPTVRKITT